VNRVRAGLFGVFVAAAAGGAGLFIDLVVD